ncbi:MAG: hypothetical protein QOC61_1002 [Acidobacteriota bacterium]|jgi:hypothetical protein|nr:hypothetical protein [Acidobacteriota bacterium]
MRGKLSGIICAAFARCAVVLLAATLSPFAHAQTSAPQSRARRTSPPPSSNQRERAQPRDSQASRAGEQASRAGEADAQADLSITAHVTANSLRFEKVPNPRVEFTGQPKRNTVWEAERENLPEHVQPGVTYRNIGITLRITSVFADIERIVAEALGEVPPTDDAQPAPAPPQQPNTAPPLQQPGTDNQDVVSQVIVSTPTTDLTQPSAPSRAASTHAVAEATANARTTPRRNATHRATHKGRVN